MSDADEPSVSEDDCAVCGHWPAADREAMRLLIDSMCHCRTMCVTPASWSSGAVSLVSLICSVRRQSTDSELIRLWFCLLGRARTQPN
jgi:hypothetical protein